jgi:hypothetical protein
VVCAVERGRAGHPFAGVFLRSGAVVDGASLWPTSDYPAIPLLIEFAGSDRSGRGHNRSLDIHVLWRFDGRAFREVARVKSQGREWVFDFLPIVEREISGYRRVTASRLA